MAEEYRDPIVYFGEEFRRIFLEFKAEMNRE